MEWLITAAGAVLVGVGLRDVFHTLWHPTGRGGLSTVMMTVVWRLTRRFPPHAAVAALSGPLSVLAVILMWAVFVVAGWTLVYWPHIPDGFSYAPGLNPEERAGIVDGLYLSLIMVGTLGLGDIVPTDAWLRLAAPFEALIGFALLTAAVSWISQIYPALTRRRLLALRLASLRAVGGLPPPPGAAATAVLLQHLAQEVDHVRLDLAQHAETYYFHDGEPDASPASMAGYAADLALQGQHSRDAAVRMSAAMLGGSLENLARTLRAQFLHRGEDARGVFAAYAADHGHPLARA
ncbi:potassium channel family protein [Streptomyces sp. NPDC096095]|uniref:potassium channel family protein n=2 Tax=unclassified Streptomyces TaxID=2593676 RepID=UPI00331DA1F3